STQGSRVLKYIRRLVVSPVNSIMKDMRIQLMSDFDSKLYGKNSEIMQTYENYQISHQEAAEVDNLIWYLSEMFKAELKIALGPIHRGGAGGGIAAVLNGLYDAEIMTSYELVDQI